MVPGVGEIVQLDDVAQVARAIESVRDLEGKLKDVRAELTHAVVYASVVQGGKTLHFEGGKAVVSGGKETTYDPEAIEEGLRAAGMPEQRIREIVKETVTYTVAAVEAKKAAAANPAYAEVIAANSRTFDKTPYIKVTLGREEHG